MNDALYAGFQDNAWPEEGGDFAYSGQVTDFIPMFYCKRNGRFGKIGSDQEFP
jgi:hypothetical protein